MSYLDRRYKTKKRYYEMTPIVGQPINEGLFVRNFSLT
ncbi:hypothetical protein GAPWK_0362 [Gilliamella apicola]|nr:hypothetical protein GAPWK_0362 [Gilliamella apicola]